MTEANRKQNVTVTLQQAADMVGVSRRTIEREIARGSLSLYRRGRGKLPSLILVDDVLGYMEEQGFDSHTLNTIINYKRNKR